MDNLENILNDELDESSSDNVGQLGRYKHNRTSKDDRASKESRKARNRKRNDNDDTEQKPEQVKNSGSKNDKAGNSWMTLIERDAIKRHIDNPSLMANWNKRVIAIVKDISLYYKIFDPGTTMESTLDKLRKSLLLEANYKDENEVNSAIRIMNLFTDNKGSGKILKRYNGESAVAAFKSYIENATPEAKEKLSRELKSNKPSTAEEKPTEEKPVEEKPAEEKPTEEKPAEEKPAEEKPAKEPSNKKGEEKEDEGEKKSDDIPEYDENDITGKSKEIAQSLLDGGIDKEVANEVVSTLAKIDKEIIKNNTADAISICIRLATGTKVKIGDKNYAVKNGKVNVMKENIMQSIYNDILNEDNIDPAEIAKQVPNIIKQVKNIKDEKVSSSDKSAIIKKKIAKLQSMYSASNKQVEFRQYVNKALKQIGITPKSDNMGINATKILGWLNIAKNSTLKNESMDFEFELYKEDIIDILVDKSWVL